MVLTPMSPFVTNTPNTHIKSRAELWGQAQCGRQEEEMSGEQIKCWEETCPNQRPRPLSGPIWWWSHSSSGWETVTVMMMMMMVSPLTSLAVVIVILMTAWLPRKAVTSSGAELPAAINVAPATSWDRPRPERDTPRIRDNLHGVDKIIETSDHTQSN